MHNGSLRGEDVLMRIASYQYTIIVGLVLLVLGMIQQGRFAMAFSEEAQKAGFSEQWVARR